MEDIAAPPESEPPASSHRIPATLRTIPDALLGAEAAREIPVSWHEISASVRAVPASVRAGFDSMPGSVREIPASVRAGFEAIPASVRNIPASVRAGFDALPASVRKIPASLRAIPASLRAGLEALPASSPVSAVLRLTDILLGAAHADQQAPSRERAALREIVAGLLGTTQLPPRVEARLREFNPAEFNLEEAVRRYGEKPAVGERKLIELVHAVCEADNTVELGENAYLTGLVLALGMEQAHCEDLVLFSRLDERGMALKRVEDLILTSAGLCVVGMPMLLIALAIKASSPGPVLFRQGRYGLDGQPFAVFKFRTMTVCEDGSNVAQATKNDARVTRLGAILRRTSLDELPQLFNVLRGEMSLVGPRPHAIAHNEKYRRLIGKYMLRHMIKPGITGWAQVNGWRGETETLEKMVGRVEHDVHYIRHWSLWLDLKILFLTIFGQKTHANVY